MKLLDENGRIGGKVNIADLIVVVLLILAVAVIGVRVSTLGRTGEGVELNTNQYVVKVDQVRQYTVDSFREGDELYNKEDGTHIGTVKAIESVPAADVHDDGTGQIAEYSVQDRFDLYLTVETAAETSDGRTFVNGVFELSKNASVQMKTKYASFTGKILEIS